MSSFLRLNLKSKIYSCFLLFRFNLKKDDIYRIGYTNNHITQPFNIFIRSDTIKVWCEVYGNIKMISDFSFKKILVSIKSREPLQFNQLWIKLSGRIISTNCKIENKKFRTITFSRNIEMGRNCTFHLHFK